MLIAQALIILFTALNAFLMVVKQKQIGLGRFDWRLQLVALGAPLLLGIAGLATKHLGPSGMWLVSFFLLPLSYLDKSQIHLEQYFFESEANKTQTY